MPQRQFLACAFAILFSFGVGTNAQQPKSFEDNVRSRGSIGEGLQSVLQFLYGQSKVSSQEVIGLHESPEQAKSLGAAVSTALSSATIILKADIDYSTQYLQMLGYDQQAFEEYAAAVRKKAKILLDVANKVVNAAADLALKAKVVQASNTDRVTVEVTTIDRASKAVDGCFVLYTPYVQDDPSHTKRFDKVTNPTTTDVMSPGRWNLWSEKDGNKSEKSEFECGDDGRDHRKKDISAPK
jgi:hypothetical protein